mmetsp:Transcript_18333/g.27629  ORF Transcript_18333/g.27629 Transcript_18333/m.27629 type:complete len:476 (-) Transcript_18333:2780-4207(-)|eukprot:scaffold33666_cov127-Skeletonema_dohrnii-CCMP3373.AAC.1
MSSGQEVGEIFGDGSGPAMSLLRSPTVIIAAVGLWGMNVYLFKLFKIDYVHVLTLDLIKEKEASARKGGDNKEDDNSDLCSVGSTGSIPGPTMTNRNSKGSKRRANSPGDSNNHGNSADSEVTAGKLIIFSLSLLLLLHMSTVTWIDFIGGSAIGAIFIFYLAVIVGILLPLPSTAWIRTACMTIFHRTFELINPRCFCLGSGIPRAIPFIDVFFADACCSLSKVFFDWGMLWHLAWHYPEPVPMELHSIIIPSVAASLPYFIRARQCLVMYTIGAMKADAKKYQHMLNAIKYSTSLWPLVVSAYQKTITNEKEKAALEAFLIVLLAINSTYSLLWDILMDWGMMQNTCAGGSNGGLTKSHSSCAHSVLRPKLRFGAPTSIGILFIDIVLRYSWVLRFWETDLFPNADIYILCTQFLEAIRRSLWNLLRVEWEHIKQNKGKEEDADDDVEMMEQKAFLAPKSRSMSPSFQHKQRS